MGAINTKYTKTFPTQKSLDEKLLGAICPPCNGTLTKTNIVYFFQCGTGCGMCKACYNLLPEPKQCSHGSCLE